MLSFTKRTDYGILALTHLAGLPEGQRANARQLAEDLGAPPELLAKVLQSMVKMGFLTSQMGPGGGYNLAWSPSEITIADVVSAIEGPISLTECLNADDECFLTETCTIRQPMGMIQQKLVQFLKTITLEDMWSGQEGIEQHETAHLHG
jgi:Rrf2 family protein